MVVVRLSSTGRKEKRNAANQPKQPARVGGIDPLGNQVEAVVCVDQFDNDHCAQQKEQDAADFAQMRFQVVQDRFTVGNGKYQHRPAQDAGDQGAGSLVEIHGMLQGNGRVAKNENQDNEPNHTERIRCIKT